MNFEVLTTRQLTLAAWSDAFVLLMNHSVAPTPTPLRCLDSSNALLDVHFQCSLLAEWNTATVASVSNVVMNVEMVVKWRALRESLRTKATFKRFDFCVDLQEMQDSLVTQERNCSTYVFMSCQSSRILESFRADIALISSEVFMCGHVDC